MKKYEYKCVVIMGSASSATRIMNEYAKEGWEFVHSYGIWHYFKREDFSS